MLSDSHQLTSIIAATSLLLLGDDSPTAAQLLHQCLKSPKTQELNQVLEQLIRLKGTDKLTPFLPRLRELGKEDPPALIHRYTRQRARQLLE